MDYQKRIHFIVSLFLFCTVFSNGVLAEACFCGQACLHSPQNKPKLAVNLTFHMRCSGTFCRSCVLEKGQIFKALNSAVRIYQVKILDMAVFFPPTDHFSTCHVFKNAESFYTRGSVSSIPIYLQNLSILC